LRRKVKQRFRGYPIATVAFYGPTADLATKIVVDIVREEGREPDPLEQRVSEDTDGHDQVLGAGVSLPEVYANCRRFSLFKISYFCVSTRNAH